MKTRDINQFQLELKIHECFDGGTRDTICRIEQQKLFLSTRGTGNTRDNDFEVIQLDDTVLDNIINRFTKEGLLCEDRQLFNPQKAANPKGLASVKLNINIGQASFKQTHFGDKSQLEIYFFLQGWLEYLENLITWEMQTYPKIIPFRRAVA